MMTSSGETIPPTDTSNEKLSQAQFYGRNTGPSAIPRLVQRLQDIACDKNTVSVDRLTKEIGAQGHAPLLMVIAVLMMLPIGMIPGIGGALGAVVAIIGLQMLLGHEGIWLPGFLGRREVSARSIRSSAERIRPAADWIHQHLHPRWEFLSSGNASISIIAVILILTGGSLTILGAIPVAAPLIGLPVAVFAFGILGRDGVVVAAGYVLIALTFAGTWLLSSAWG